MTGKSITQAAIIAVAVLAFIFRGVIPLVGEISERLDQLDRIEANTSAILKEPVCFDRDNFKVADYGMNAEGAIWAYGEMNITETPCGWIGLVASAGDFSNPDAGYTIPYVVVSCGKYDLCDENGQGMKRPSGRQRWGIWYIPEVGAELPTLRLIVLHSGGLYIQQTLLWEVDLPLSADRKREPPPEHRKLSGAGGADGRKYRELN